MARRLMTIPGLGPVMASAMAASVQDVSAFSGSREFAAFLGLTPRQNSSGAKERLGRTRHRKRKSGGAGIVGQIRDQNPIVLAESPV